MNLFQQIRNRHGVPARLRGRLTFEGRPGEIVGSDGDHLVVMFDDGIIAHIHPTWHVEYDEQPAPAKAGGA